MSAVTLDHVREARERIGGMTVVTPVVGADVLSRHTGADVHCKLESLQRTGSFKLRGAANHILAGRAASAPVAFSTGNHGRAVATVARELGTRAIVFVGGDTDPTKLAGLRASGAEVRVAGATQDDAARAAARLARDEDLDLVAPFDDPGVIAGQGTIALELLEQLPDLDTIVVPVSGGGLIAGVALAAKALAPGVRVVGVCAARTPGMWASRKAGHPVAAADDTTLADSLRGGIGADNRFTFGLVQEHVDAICSVPEEAIGDAIAYGLRHEGLVLEGAAAVGIAALLHRLVDVIDQRVAVVLTGRNVSLAQVLDVEARRRGALASLLGASDRVGVG